MSPYLASTPEQLGPLLRGFRVQQGVTQAELALRIGLTQKDISLAETHPSRLGVERLFKLFAALNVELLLREKSERTKKVTEW